MIIPQDSSSPKRDDPVPSQHYSPSAPPQNSSSPPPPPPYTDNQDTLQYVVPVTFVERRISAERRFFRAFLVALSIWILAGIFVSSAVELHKSRQWNVAKGNIGIPEDDRVDDCVPWTRVTPEHPRFSLSASGTWSRARINLPVEADALYLTARGTLASGDVYVRESHEAEDMSVTIFVNHRSRRALSHATVCRLSRDGGEMGVGIFTSFSHFMPWHPRGSDLRFIVEVGLPPSRGTVRHISSFHADLPMFALAMDDLSAFHFGDIDLKSSNRPIKAKGVVANTLKVNSINGAISGNFNTTSSLTLITTNSRVSVKVGAENMESERSTEVLIQTVNAPIEADISLTSKSSVGTGGIFGVHAHTTNGPINIVYDDSPVDSVLNFDAQSTNAPVHAVLHDAYEGSLGSWAQEKVIDAVGDQATCEWGSWVVAVETRWASRLGGYQND